MNIIINGNKVTLTQKDYVTQGGEGKIFQRGNIAYKVYDDLNKMVPLGKIQELSELNSPSIVRPIDIIYTTKKEILGFTMVWLGDDNYPLCKLFTNTFRDANGVTNDHIIELVENIKNIIISPIHEKGCLMVDGNELNYLVKPDFITPLFIDVNSYKTRSFPPTAIMPSIRDWTVEPKDFSVLSDWYSFAVVTFQLFVGIHPYKGKHKKYDRNDFEKRVKDHVSVFNKDVNIPPTARSFDLIPTDYKDWYYRIFEKGERCLPPKMPGTIKTVQVQTIIVSSSDNFEIKEINVFEDNIVYHNDTVTKTVTTLYVGKNEYKVSSGTEVLFTPFKREPIFCKVDNFILKIMSPDGISVQQIDLNCTEKMIINDTLYVKSMDKLIELKIMDTKILMPVINKTWSIEAKSSKIYSGIVVQSVLGRAYICIPLPDFKNSSFIIKDIPELDKLQIVDAKHENHVAMFITADGGSYDRYIVVFNDDYSSYVVRKFEDIDYIPLNFIVLENGICISIREDDVVEIFHNKKPEKVKEIKDPKVDSTMNLCKKGMEVRFFKGNKLFSLKVKS